MVLGYVVRKVACQKECPMFPKVAPVSGTGDYTSSIALVGEAPGSQEKLEGTPFIGPAGRVLMSSLEDMGVKRSSLYITNSVKCMPVDFHNEKVTPSNRLVTACVRSHLQKELSEMPNLRLIVCLGKVATFAVLRGKKISSGSELRMSQDIPEKRKVWVFSMMHPAAVLHNPMNRPRYERDVEKLYHLIKEIL